MRAEPDDFDLLLGLVEQPQELADLAHLPRWAWWRLEEKGRKIARCPQNPDRKAASNNSETWAARENAEAAARREGVAGQVGLKLGPGAPGPCVGGVDLDGCRDPATGAIDPWAAEILERFATYAEVSPSGTGAKALFRYEAADLPRLREAWAPVSPSEWGPSFLRASHCGPELHLGGRWYAITGKRLPGAPATLRELPTADMLWLVTEAGPRFKAGERAGLQARVKGDSEELLAEAARVKGNGGTLAEFRERVRANPPAWAHVERQGRARPDNPDRCPQERAIRRAWNRTHAAPVECDIDELEDLSGAPAAEAGDLPDLSDIGLAIGLNRAGWGDRARWCGPLGGWLLWDGARWLRAEKREEFTAAQKYLAAVAKKLVDGSEGEARECARRASTGLKSAGRVAAVEMLSRSRPGTAVAPGDFDADDLALGTPGGVVDLRTGSLRPAKRSDLITRSAAVAPAGDDEGPPERWLRFLQECFPGQPEVPAFLQRLAGYALTGSTREHKLFFFWGEGRNGKGTFLNLLTWLFGDYAQTVAPTVLLESRNPLHSAPLAMLRGARLARASEISSGAAWNEAELKRLTGGDPITANLMRQDPITFVPKLTLVIDANRRPRIRTVDAAMRARMVFVPWRESFAGREDTGLAGDLRAEGPAILRWAVEGAVAWQQGGLGIPPEISAASADYLESEDELGQFLADHTVADKRGRVSTAALHRRFRDWQQERGDREWSQRALAVALQERGFRTYRAKVDGASVRGIEGLRLRESPDVGADLF